MEYEGLTEEEILNRAEELIAAKELDEAQSALDAVKEESGRKYFLQSKIFAAKNWTKERIRQLAYAINLEPNNSEYLAARAEAHEAEEALLTDEDYLKRAELHIQHWDYKAAEAALNRVKEKSARKCYLMSKVYKSKNWLNEQRKQLKQAVKAEPDNEIYKKELEELEALRKTPEYKREVRKRQMGEVGGICAEGVGECCGYLCCGAICEGIGNGC